MYKSHLKKIDWSSYMAVGVVEIDEQHKKFLDIANDAVDAVLSHNQSAVDTVIEQLKDYAQYHFDTEADLMTKYKYPESSAHYNAHIDFHDKIAVLENSASASKEAELISFMQNWLIMHIGSTDRKLADFINK